MRNDVRHHPLRLPCVVHAVKNVKGPLARHGHPIDLIRRKRAREGRLITADAEATASASQHE